jgi:hypothetical protein
VRNSCLNSLLPSNGSGRGGQKEGGKYGIPRPDEKMGASAGTLMLVLLRHLGP